MTFLLTFTDRLVASRPLAQLRTLALSALAALALGLLSLPAQAQAPYPNKPIKWIVPFAPGGSGDLIARLLAERMGQALGQPVIIDNRGGNGSVLGTDLAARAPADGYTWVLSNGAAITTGPLMGQTVGYQPLEDFVHVQLIGSFANALIVRHDHPAKTVQDLLALARDKPGKLSYGSAGVGSAGNLTGELLKQLAKIQMVHVPYKGSGPALNDLMGGQIDLVFASVLAAVPHIKSGKVKAIAVPHRTRAKLLPDVPTVAESGYAGYEISNFVGINAPAGTPAAVIDRLYAAVAAAIATPAVQERMITEGLTPVGSRPEAYAEFLRSEHDKWARVIKQAGLTRQ